MAKTVEEEFSDIKSEDEAVKKIMQFRVKIQEDFARAYLAETLLKPSEVEMVTVQHPMTDDHKIVTTIYFRVKEKNEQP